MVKDDENNTPAIKVLTVAKELFNANANWVTFYREIIGVDGAIRREFTDVRAFEKTDEYGDIMLMLAKLRDASSIPPLNEESKVITVRLPKSIHESLRAEAHENQTSMNKLCISKLLQPMLGDPNS